MSKMVLVRLRIDLSHAGSKVLSISKSAVLKPIRDYKNKLSTSFHKFVDPPPAKHATT